MTDEDALRAEVAERRLAQARADARALAQHNDKLNVTLREARDQLLALREQVAALALPPQQFGIVVGLPEAGLADVHVGGRLVRAAVAPEVVAVERLGVGAGVLVNEALVVVAVTDHRPAGEVVRVRERLDATSALVRRSWRCCRTPRCRVGCTATSGRRWAIWSAPTAGRRCRGTSMRW